MTNIFSFVLCSWDEWVLEDRVLKYNDANIQKQKEVSKQHASTSAKNKKGASANIGNVYGSSNLYKFLNYQFQYFFNFEYMPVQSMIWISI